ncbi:SIR2 family NAD-dependent protein deacylase [Hugenholtzia roseola]|uniref:SIR2 family NAD-dependent protein deacylase n=1 Tax=Hugenholtzia roseola TaxID=1002 RepID=UPI0004065E5B|nr:NAD-dependent deacylase [Hugenholtzia roseola]
MKKKIVALTGAGISAESGIPTFRDANGLWEGHRIEDVATPEAWQRNPDLVLDFYNQRRKAAQDAKPNDGHKILAALERFFEVTVITQNVDNLHEKAGSTHVLHLHGELFKARSVVEEKHVVEMQSWELKKGDLCPWGKQLRPHIVWFGEAVPMMETAMFEAMEADIFLVIGTSMLVYPAAGLIEYVRSEAPKFVIDPKIPQIRKLPNLHFIPKVASAGMKQVEEVLLNEYV